MEIWKLSTNIVLLSILQYSFKFYQLFQYVFVSVFGINDKQGRELDMFTENKPNFNTEKNLINEVTFKVSLNKTLKQEYARQKPL